MYFLLLVRQVISKKEKSDLLIVALKNDSDEFFIIYKYFLKTLIQKL